MTSQRMHQRGASIWMILIMVIVLGFAAIFGLKVIPIYLESYKIDKAMEGSLQGAADQSVQAIRDALIRRMDIDDVKVIDFRNVKDHVRITKKGASVTMETSYDAEVHLFANLWVVARFDKVRTN